MILIDGKSNMSMHLILMGKVRHLHVLENRGVVSILEISKCLYDAIVRMERAVEKGKAITTAVKGVEKHWGTSVSRLNGNGTFTFQGIITCCYKNFQENEIPCGPVIIQIIDWQYWRMNIYLTNGWKNLVQHLANFVSHQVYAELVDCTGIPGPI